MKKFNRICKTLNEDTSADSIVKKTIEKRPNKRNKNRNIVYSREVRLNSENIKISLIDDKNVLPKIEFYLIKDPNIGGYVKYENLKKAALAYNGLFDKGPILNYLNYHIKNTDTAIGMSYVLAKEIKAAQDRPQDEIDSYKLDFEVISNVKPDKEVKEEEKESDVTPEENTDETTPDNTEDNTSEEKPEETNDTEEPTEEPPVEEPPVEEPEQDSEEPMLNSSLPGENEKEFGLNPDEIESIESEPESNNSDEVPEDNIESDEDVNDVVGMIKKLLKNKKITISLESKAEAEAAVYKMITEKKETKPKSDPKRGIIWAYESNGKEVLHREDGPAEIDKKFDMVAWWKNGKLDRKDAPAVVYIRSKILSWYKDGKLHRTDGPALIDNKGKLKWAIQGKIFTDKNIHIMPISIRQYYDTWTDKESERDIKYWTKDASTFLDDEDIENIE